MYRILILVAGLLISTQSFAHAGHDHSDPMSSLVHLFWLAPLIIAAGLLISYLKRRFSEKSQKITGTTHRDL